MTPRRPARPEIVVQIGGVTLSPSWVEMSSLRLVGGRPVRAHRFMLRQRWRKQEGAGAGLPDGELVAMVKEAVEERNRCWLATWPATLAEFSARFDERWAARVADAREEGATP